MNVFCRGEGSSFPDNEFLYNKDGTLFVPHIHKASPPHYASTGHSVSDPGNAIPGTLLVRLHNTLARAAIADIEAWVKERGE
jgi:hypothetical protein